MLNRASAFVASCSVIALVALLIVPSTRWIAWSLFRSEFDLLKPTTQSEKIERSALKHPNDIDSQITSAVYSGVHAQYGKVNTVPKKDVSLELEKLLSNHSNSVALYANILRMMTSRRVTILREESYIFSQVPIKSIAARTAEDDANFEKYDRFAAVGEKLDPGNAYFPTMRSIRLTAAHKDKDSLEALHRASSCSHWNAYIIEPIRAGIRLAEEDGGRGPGMTSTYPLLVARNPNFAQLRELARVVAYIAEEQEKKSKFDSGIEIRLDVARLGSLLRFDETQLIGTLSGVAITLIAEMDPEGIRLSSAEMKLNSDEKHKIRVTRFKIYLEKHARKETQIWFAKENAKTIQLKKILETGLNRSPILTNLPVLTLLWVSGLLLLSNALVAICFGLLHHLSFKTSNFPIKETAFALFIALFYWQWSCLRRMGGSVLQFYFDE